MPEPLPEPLRGNETGTFAHHSVAVRLPAIAARVAAAPDVTAAAGDRMRRLAAAIPSGAIEPLSGDGPDQAEWDDYVSPFVGASWLDVPWFFAEYYFYRRILDAVGYWDGGGDPYLSQKRLGFDQAVEPARASLRRADAAYARGVGTEQLLIELTDAALWGNQIDLSLWPAEPGGSAATDYNSDRLLVDDRPAVIRGLHDRHPPPIAFVLDNCGAELIADLLLADMLLRGDLASRITLHVKAYPVFVSDATGADVVETIRRMAADADPHMRSAGERLQAEVDHRLLMTAPAFWVSPLEWRRRPMEVDRELGSYGLVIFKGDANYRRLLGDRHWPLTTPFAAAIGSTPAPLLALRTLKSEVAAGLEAGAIAAAAAADPEWMQNGRWAVASAAPQQMTQP